MTTSNAETFVTEQLTVRELMEKLAKADPDAKVVLAVQKRLAHCRSVVQRKHRKWGVEVWIR